MSPSQNPAFPGEKPCFPSSVAQKVATSVVENGCERLMVGDETDPELGRLVKAWANLSATAKRMILAALDADQPRGGE